jgi:hypothetical protein
MLNGTRTSTGDNTIVENHDKSLAIVSTVVSVRITLANKILTERDTPKSDQRPTEKDKDRSSSSRQPIGERFNSLETSNDHGRTASKDLHASEGVVASILEAGCSIERWKYRL